MNLSVAIITFNEEKNIRRLLEKIHDLADEIVVVDSHSTDGTAEIARSYEKVKLIPHAFEGYGRQKNFAISQCSGEWIFFPDADEIPDDLAKSEIKKIVEDGGLVDVYKIEFNNIFLGRVLHHGEWGNVWRERLFRRGSARYSDDPVHETFITEKEIGTLKGKIHHYTYRDISHHLDKTNRYTSMMAQKMLQNGKKSSVWKLVLSPIFQFFKTYIFQLGFLDGIPGFYGSINAAFYTFSKYMKLYELQRPR